LAGIRADTAFLGISGISADGTLLDTTVEEIPVKRVMASAAKRVVLLADGAKFWGSGLGRVGSVDVVDTLVTTDDAPPDTLERFAGMGVEVITAAAQVRSDGETGA